MPLGFSMKREEEKKNDVDITNASVLNTRNEIFTVSYSRCELKLLEMIEVLAQV